MAEFPHFQEVVEARGTEFNLVSVSVDPSGDPAAFAASKGLSWNFGEVGDRAVTDMYGITGIPATFFYDKSGQLVDQVVGGMSREEFEQRLAKIL
ncbi:TlpA family protein disulfide reductase [bacterium]|nr:TlpA family protein disulfide reductase [bacterium]